jgi:predicted TIM-barrel fold metal-dependent hydrolase
MGAFNDNKLKDPIINCHTHIFTGDHVPPYLAKTFLPWPLYYLLPVSLLVKAFRYWYKIPNTWQFKPWYKSIKWAIYQTKIYIARYGILAILSFIIGLFLTLQVFFILVDWISILSSPDENTKQAILDIREWLENYWILLIPASWIGKAALILLLFIFFKSGRNLIWFLMGKIWSFLGVLPGAKSKELAARYLKLARFTFYKKQSNVFQKLKNQYPEKSKFIILPMDMEFMEAGKLKKDNGYDQQIRELAVMKGKVGCQDIFYPFLFANPRRMEQETDKHFSYKIDQSKIVLNDCFIKKYIEEHHFSGFKIYPPLGYYPFDETLLPLWKYAADNSLPIMTHCIRGTIYYRGGKKSEWDSHPVFKQLKSDKSLMPLQLMESKNRDFCNNFTHPLNYLCLLEEQLLRKIVGKAKDNRLLDVFGYIDENTPMKYNLNHLKICFGHFGGDDEWMRYLEMDRDNYTSQIIKKPERGIAFLSNIKGEPSPGKIEYIWRHVDWYSIICSLILQYPNVYGDLSYIIHTPEIQPLLKLTLINPGLRNKVLFGTDFYVVRNHKSEKNLLADILDQLSVEDFDQIARTNPKIFLSNALP